MKSNGLSGNGTRTELSVKMLIHRIVHTNPLAIARVSYVGLYFSAVAAPTAASTMPT